MRAVYTARYVKSGNGWGIIIPKDVREHLGLRPTDLIVMRVVGKVLVMRRFDASQVIDTNSIPVDALPSDVRS